MAGQSSGFEAQLALNGQAMEFTSLEDLSQYDLVDNGDRAMRGILDHIKERVTEGLQRFRFKVTMDPSPAELDVILPLIGFTESPTDTFTVTDDFSSLSFTSIIDRKAKVHTYATCYVDKAIFRGQKGNRPVSLELEIVGTSMTEGASFSATGITSDIAFAFYEGQLDVQGLTDVAFDRFALIIDNHLNVEFNNSQTASSICPSHRTIHLVTSTPYTSTEQALFGTPGPASNDSAGATGTLAFTRAGQSTSFAFANLKSIATPPDIANKAAEIRNALTYKCYKSGSTAALVVTHDATA